MGVLENRRNVYFSADIPRGDDGQQTSSDEDVGGWEVNESTEAPPVAAPPRARPPPSPVSPRKRSFGHKLRLKKGRRSRQRCEEERKMVYEVFGTSELPEDVMEGLDVPNPSRSHFTTLLEVENASLLQDFVEDRVQTESSLQTRQQQQKEQDLNDPEAAFLGISAAQRGALRKHYHEGALEELERDIMEFFRTNPESEFIVDNLSGYERLLAHAASKYHHLQSRSFDEDGTRKLKIDNPAGNFVPIDPSLSKYLRIRTANNKKHRGL